MAKLPQRPQQTNQIFSFGSSRKRISEKVVCRWGQILLITGENVTLVLPPKHKYQVANPREVRKQFNPKPGQMIMFIPCNGILRVCVVSPVNKARTA
jgi:hypothetical protein